MGTATFLAWMTVVVVVWVVWNSAWGPERPRWDEYPFIFLTLILSLQASYAAPLILLAQNRQEARDRVQQEQDRDANAQSHADMEFLAREVASLRMGIGEVATRDFLRGELRGLLETLEQADSGDEPDDKAPYVTSASLRRRGCSRRWGGTRAIFSASSMSWALIRVYPVTPETLGESSVVLPAETSRPCPNGLPASTTLSPSEPNHSTQAAMLSSVGAWSRVPV